MRPIIFSIAVSLLFALSHAASSQCHIEILNPDPVHLCPGDSVHLMAEGECNNSSHVSWSHGVSSLDGGWVSPNQTHAYSVFIMDTMGNSATDQISVIVTEPSVTITGDDTINYYGGSTLLDAGPGYKSYFWSTGERSRTLLVESNMVSPGDNTFSVTTTDQNGCTARDTFTVFASVSSSIANKEASDDIRIHPNPSNGIFTIDGHEKYENITVEIYNPAGQKIQTHNTNNRQFPVTIELSDKASGMYFLKLFNDEITLRRKLIIR